MTNEPDLFVAQENLRISAIKISVLAGDFRDDVRTESLDEAQKDLQLLKFQVDVASEKLASFAEIKKEFAEYVLTSSHQPLPITPSPPVTNQEAPQPIEISVQPETLSFLAWLQAKKKFRTIEEAAVWIIEDWADKFLERVNPQ